MTRRVRRLLVAAGSALVIGVSITVLWSSFLLPASTETPPAPSPAGTRPAAGPEELSLGPDAVVERELAGGETQSFRVALEAGQLLHLIVEQKGIDAVVVFRAPDGRQLAEVDSPNGTAGPEPLLAVAEVTGAHRVEVRALDGQAAPGRYELRIAEQRAASALDRARTAGERHFEEAYRLIKSPQPDSLRRAAEGFAAALEDFRAAGAQQRQAEALYYRGWVASNLGQSREALGFYTEARDLFAALGDREQEADTLNDLGRAHRLLGDLGGALEHYHRALPLRRAIGDRRGEAVTLNNLGLVHSLRGEKQRALDLFSRVVAMWRELEDPRQEAITRGNLGHVYEALGLTDEALDQHESALRLLRQTGDLRSEAVTLTRIGALHIRSGDPRLALDPLHRALELRRQVEDLRGEAVTLGFLGDTRAALGEVEGARQLYQQALEIHRRLGDERGEALVLNNLGWLYASTGDPEPALSSFRRSLGIQQRVADPAGEAATRFGIARAERELGRPREALTFIEAALDLVEGQRGDAASLSMRSSYFASKHHYQRFHIDLLMELHRREPGRGWDARAFEASERARARSLLDALGEAGGEIRRGVEPALRERERELQGRIDEASRQVRELEVSGDGTGRPAEAERELRELLLAYQTLRAEIRLASPRYAALTETRPLDLGQTRRLLDPETVLLEYALGEERSYLWVVTASSLTAFELPAEEEIEAQARRAWELLSASHRRQARAQTEMALERLAGTLLAPAAAELGRRRLVVVTEGALQLLPFAALPDPGASAGAVAARPPLMAGHEIVHLPSASVLWALRQRQGGRAPAALIVLADPVLSPDDPRVTAPVRRRADGAEPGAVPATTRWRRLPFSRREGERILALLPPGQGRLALGFEASREAALGGELSRYRVVHFATHAVPDPRHPDLSGIVLSMVDGRGRPQDGFLRLYEIPNLHLAADLVVLSSCETALGRDLRGEGLVGLARGFLDGGAARVLVSLWQVSDRATAELMARFYGHMITGGLAPAAALRQAQLSMAREAAWRAPYFWAGFVLQGEWR